MTKGLLCNAGFNVANITPEGWVTACHDRHDDQNEQ